MRVHRCILKETFQNMFIKPEMPEESITLHRHRKNTLIPVMKGNFHQWDKYVKTSTRFKQLSHMENLRKISKWKKQKKNIYNGKDEAISNCSKFQRFWVLPASSFTGKQELLNSAENIWQTLFSLSLEIWPFFSKDSKQESISLLVQFGTHCVFIHHFLGRTYTVKFKSVHQPPLPFIFLFLAGSLQ